MSWSDGAAAQPAAGESDPEWVSFVSVTRLSDDFLERPEAVSLTGPHAQSWRIQGQRVSLPAPLDRRALFHDTYVVLEVGRRGEAAGCRLLRATIHPQLDSLSCDYLMRPGLFRAPIAPRQRAGRWVMGLSWWTETAADFANRQRSPEIVLPPPVVRPAQPLHFPPPVPPSREPRRWISGRLLPSDYTDLTDRRLIRPQFLALVSVDERGKPTECRVLRGTGNRAVDVRTCQVIVRRVLFSQRVDAEGRLIADRTRVYIDVGRLVRGRGAAE